MQAPIPAAVQSAAIQSAIVSYISEGFVCFTFANIYTKRNSTGIEKKHWNPPLWKEINATNMVNHCHVGHLGLAILTGRISGITALDFDDWEEYQRLLRNFPTLAKYRTIRTNKGCHVYFKYN